MKNPLPASPVRLAETGREHKLMANETQKEKGWLEKSVSQILLSLITLGIITLITLVFGINNKLIVLEINDKIRTDRVDKIEIKQDKMDLDVYDLKQEVKTLKTEAEDRNELRSKHR